MGRILSNSVSLAYSIEDSLGELAVSPEWTLLEPNAISTFGSTITTVARSPISENRQRRKGVITDLDSAVEFDADITIDHFVNFMEGFAFASFNGPPVFEPTAATAGGSGGYTVPSGGALAANTLVYARGFVNAANNGLKLVQSGSTGTNIRVDSLVAETAPANALVEVAGRRGASGDIQIDSNGDLIATSLDFTTLSLTAGQSIWIGGEATANKFATAADRGFARIVTIAAGKLTLDKTSQTFTTDNGSGKLIDVYFGRFLRNVAIDDGDYIERSFQFELAEPNLDNPSGDMYEYAKGNYCNQVSFDLPLANKAVSTFGFIGTDTEPPTGTRATNADTPELPLRTEAFNTTSDIARLRIQEVDETGITTDFKTLTMTLNNNVSPEKVIGQLGAKFLNTGIFEVDIEAQLLFTNAEVVEAIRENRTVTMDFAMRNNDGCILVDIPSMILGAGNKEFPVNESVLINTTAQAFQDTIFGTSIGVSLFPFVPAS